MAARSYTEFPERKLSQPEGWGVGANNSYGGESTEVGGYDKSGRAGAPAHDQKGEAPEQASFSKKGKRGATFAGDFRRSSK